MTACSACNALLPAGAPHCPRCASPITAFAIPVVRRVKPVPSFPYWSLWLGLGIVALYFLVDLSTKYDQAKQEARIAALRALVTPAAIQAHCGRPLSVVSTPHGRS